MTSDEINQISFELNEDEFCDDSFSESSLYDTIDENQSIPTIPRENINDMGPERNRQLVESSEYAVYNNDHRYKPWVEWLKLQRMKIVIIALLLVIIASVAVSLVSVMNSAEARRVYPIVNSTVDSTTLPETLSDVSTTDVSTTPSVTKPTDVTSAYVSTAQSISPENSTTGKTLKADFYLGQKINSLQFCTSFHFSNYQDQSTLTTVEITPNGVISDWKDWTDCSRSCGNGIKIRERMCLKHICTQSLHDQVSCNLRGCE